MFKLVGDDEFHLDGVSCIIRVILTIFFFNETLIFKYILPIGESGFRPKVHLFATC